jgi:orotidine-5'-phosphate decarboxylase
MSAMERLKTAMDTSGSCACVGIDPVLERFPDEIEGDHIQRMRAFCLGVLDSVVGKVGVVKPQSACFERFGSAGYGVLEQVVGHAKDLGLVVILDAKRGDIGSSAAHYAGGAHSMGADFITCSPYMGRSSIEPFLEAELGVFALCRTSNPDADELQCLAINDGSTLAQHTARMITALGDQVGAVVGATNNTAETAMLRREMPGAMFLVPGVGAQGGTVHDVKAMCIDSAKNHGGLGVVINASRSVLFPNRESGESWKDAVGRAAASFASDCATLLD